MKSIFYIVLLSVFLIQCTTTPRISEEHGDRGIWSGKVQMINKTTNHKKWANVTWASDSSQDMMRVNVSAVFDVPIATYLKNQQGAHLWLFNEKRYYQSNDAEKLFLHLTKLSIDPNIFYSLLGEPKSPGSDWKCLDKGSRFQCRSNAKKARLSVLHETPDERVIKIEKGSKALQIRLFRSKVQVHKRLFEPLSTSQFKTFQL